MIQAYLTDIGKPSDSLVPEIPPGTYTSARAAADLCHLAEDLVRRWISDGRVRVERRGLRVLVSLDDVHRLASAGEVG
jgi:hypothetical protein